MACCVLLVIVITSGWLLLFSDAPLLHAVTVQPLMQCWSVLEGLHFLHGGLMQNPSGLLLIEVLWKGHNRLMPSEEESCFGA